VLWYNGIVVVVSAGNSGGGGVFAPANDPFVITVGATNDHGTPGLADDTVATFSTFGITESGFSKPDLVAPGTNIISLLPSNNRLTISQQHSGNRVNNNYFRMSGTSMAAPIVSGAAALLLQSNPNLTPDQVKNRLKLTANRNLLQWPAYNPVTAGAGYLDIYAAVHSGSTLSLNTGIHASQLLWTGLHPIVWQSVNWDSVNWDSVNWDSVNWDSVNWDSVNWSSDYWGQ
jgi:serine protease AprX